MAHLLLVLAAGIFLPAALVAWTDVLPLGGLSRDLVLIVVAALVLSTLAGIVPAVLAEGERLDASGADLLRAGGADQRGRRAADGPS